MNPSPDPPATAPDGPAPAAPGAPGAPAAEAAALHFLELLAADAPAEAYQERTPAGAGAARARALALRVRAELEGRRRREAELTALFETARDISGLRDLDSVLRAIVQRARSLLGTEVAYMTLTDPERGDTYMRVTEGSVSARFQQLRLGMGEGLGGLVAQTARPYVTADYMADERFRHTRSIDGGVREEGLVAILGVPLLLGREVIGVLYAADRRSRVFDREQISLLASFAAHAAIAIDTARLLEETRAALAELESANGIIRDRSRVIERAAGIHDRLTAIVLHGGGVADVTSAVSEILGGKVEFIEESASPRPGRGGGPAGRAVLDDGIWTAAVTAGGETLGALLLHGRPDLDPVDCRTLERAAMVTSLLLLARRTAGEAEQRVRGELLDDLLDTPDRDPRLLRERAARLRAELDLPHLVLAARAEHDDAAGGPAGSEGGGRRRLWSAASHLAVTRHGLATSRDGRTVLLLPAVPGQTASRLAAQVAAQLGAAVGLPVTVGAAEPVAAPLDEPAQVAAAWTEARRCLDTLRLLGRTGQGAAARDLGFLGLLLSDSRDIDGFVRRTIGPLLDYDARRGTELAATLEAYFASGMSAARAKDALHIHVNTVTQRLDRIARLLGTDWQSPDRVLEIQLALRLHHLSHPAGP
ncbi:helix-turn-helix domain-containing protein [Streptomyces aidingensis]|nr:GAF domain-containing protein [Streptomyces aidingensis]